MEQDTRPRFITAQEGFLLILRGVNCNPGSDPDDMVVLRMSFEENRIITIWHNRRVMAINDIHEATEAGSGPKNAVGFLTMVIGRMVNRMGDVVTDIDDQVDELEDTVLTAESYELRSQLDFLVVVKIAELWMGFSGHLSDRSRHAGLELDD